MNYDTITTNPAVCKFFNMYNRKDCFNIYESGARIEYNTILDFLNKLYFDKAHRDGIQLIPEVFNQGYNLRYCLSALRDIKINHNHIISENHLQGIFASDGTFHNLEVKHNMIKTRSAHYITFAGLISGRFSNNVDHTGAPCPILLQPARVGGNKGGLGNDYIVSFRNAADDYKIITGSNTFSKNFTDNRRGDRQKKENDRYWYDLDLAGFMFRCAQTKPNEKQMKLILSDYAILQSGKRIR